MQEFYRSLKIMLCAGIVMETQSCIRILCSWSKQQKNIKCRPFRLRLHLHCKQKWTKSDFIRFFCWQHQSNTGRFHMWSKVGYVSDVLQYDLSLNGHVAFHPKFTSLKCDRRQDPAAKLRILPNLPPPGRNFSDIQVGRNATWPFTSMLCVRSHVGHCRVAVCSHCSLMVVAFNLCEQSCKKTNKQIKNPKIRTEHQEST